MPRVLSNELRDLRENMMTCFQKTLPNKQFMALLTLSICQLGVLADREAETQDEKERRCIEDELTAGKRTIEKGIEMLYEQTHREKVKDPDSP